MDVLKVEEPRFSVGEIFSNVAMAVVLGYITWRAYQVLEPIVFDESIELPEIFSQSPAVEDHLPEGFESGEFNLAQSRFIAQTRAGFQYWLLAAEDEGGVCLYLNLRSGDPVLECVTMEEFANSGVLLSFAEGDEAPGESRYGGAARYVTEGMEVNGLPDSTETLGLFSFVEGQVAASKGDVAAFVGAQITGGRELAEVDSANLGEVDTGSGG